MQMLPSKSSISPRRTGGGLPFPRLRHAGTGSVHEATFARDGYQIVRGVLSPETIASVRGFLEESLAEAFAIMAPWSIRQDDPDNGRKIAHILASAAPGTLADDVKKTMLGHFPLATRLSERLWAVARETRLQAILREVLGSERLFMHMPPAARFVLPHNTGAMVPAHHDVSYNEHMAEFVTVWVPFVEIDEACGGMTMFEGSQNATERHDEKSELWLKRVPTTGYRPRVCGPLSPGDVIVFNKWIIHESRPNVSTRTRLSIDYRFFPGRVVSGKHALDMQSWRVLPPGASGPNADGYRPESRP